MQMSCVSLRGLLRLKANIHSAVNDTSWNTKYSAGGKFLAKGGCILYSWRRPRIRGKVDLVTILYSWCSAESINYDIANVAKSSHAACAWN